MCGMAGFWVPGGAEQGSLEAQARTMADALLHRGPDDGGVWAESRKGLALAHRRLAILDLSAAGHQPMASASGRYVIVFNGEIYNHLSLRERLQQQGQALQWRGHSDTETLLAALSAWGFAETLSQLVGMFALAVWDAKTEELLLARDRFGEKPLYYGWQRGVFLFGSELKSLRQHPAFEGRLHHEALAQMLRYSYVPNPLCIYEGLHKLLPGHFLRLSMAHGPQALPVAEPYWTPWPALQAGLNAASHGTDAEAVDQLGSLLRTAVQQQCLSDVPLGALLSGGVDSSLVVALMQAQASQPVRTFTIGFHEKAFDEAGHARAVAQHLGTAHTELYVSPQDSLNLIPELPILFDEPLGDYSVIPTTLVARLARQQVSVALSGDGGDELHCGYSRYVETERRWRTLSAWPLVLRRTLAGMVRAVTHSPRALRAADVLAMPDLPTLYEHTQAYWRAPVVGGVRGYADRMIPKPLSTQLDVWQTMMATDLTQYLPEHILAKVDRAAMSVSLETRAPLLDHRLAEFALAQPMHRHRRQGQGKWLLRQVLYQHVPKALIERPKMGFTVPIDTWMRGPLRDWAESLLATSALADCFEPRPIREAWARYLAGDARPAQYLWNVLTAQQWLQAQRLPSRAAGDLRSG